MAFMMDLFLRALLVFSFASLHLLAGPVFSAAFNIATDRGKDEGPLVITSNTLEIDNEKKTVTFTGKVTAKKDEWVIHSDKMILFYAGETAQSGTDTEKVRVDKIVASGGVQILRSGGGEAKAEEAVFYQADEKIILTGKPVVQQGEDFVEGSKITLFLKENRSIVEGSEKEKVRAVIAPRTEER
jgi:lipopolysaccharide export system protein LptA